LQKCSEPLLSGRYFAPLYRLQAELLFCSNPTASSGIAIFAPLYRLPLAELLFCSKPTASGIAILLQPDCL